ncbi:hypothetical protein BIV57_17105 [Mangrovactinospora gilvigrisea]|uniref:Maltokinase N-terminal cap domain-containing protein n=1 Tax=Mangrovactinospora gilvigrisea TaxID=1428644 RepID=A0A1J7BC93_9ACTN|nr:hypothetical protein [Mangrovactinospora gilvigrisea]OIV36291.1 hypothetical protein BIV57_17105 [Mangrovactinospora gilvigrisea]
MAFVHNTTLVPSKLDLLTGWLPDRPWYVPRPGGPALERVGGFRLDDPDGEVGIELMAAADGGAGGTVYHLPLAYRGAPLPGAPDDALLGTSEHGVLGTRWIYDGSRDPVLLAALLGLLAGRARAQAQRISDTPDPTVGVGTLAAAAVPEAPKESAAVDASDTSHATLLALAGGRTLRIERRLADGGQEGPGRVVAGFGGSGRGLYFSLVEASSASAQADDDA